MQRVAVLGLGAIGLGVARNLVKAGFEVRGFDIAAPACDALTAAGGTVCTAAEAVADASVVIVAVFDEQQADELLFGAAGIAGTLAAGTTVLMHTTMAAAGVRALGERLAGAGHSLVDAPVTGGRAGADAGTLTAILSGDARTLDDVWPLMQAYCARRYVVGNAAGAATTVKMINQLLMGVHLAATAEAIALAEKAGADAQLVRDVITHGTGFSRAFESRAELMSAGSYDDVRGALDIFVKDLGLVDALSRETGASTPLAERALAAFREASDRGLGALDCSALVEIYRRNEP